MKQKTNQNKKSIPYMLMDLLLSLPLMLLARKWKGDLWKPDP